MAGQNDISRNGVQIAVKQCAERSKAYKAVENVIARNLASWQDWESFGYAAAFDDAWKSGMRPMPDGSVDNIVTYVLAVAGTRSSCSRTLNR